MLFGLIRDCIRNVQGGGRSFIPAIGVVLALLAAAFSVAQADRIEGLSYSLEPGAEYLQWEDNLGLEDGTLYGGRFGLNFGRYVALRGFYFGNKDFKITSNGVPEDEGSDLGHMDVANYGADLALYYPYGSVFPFIYGGGGVYRFDPSEGDRLKKIGLRLGGGLRFAVTPRIEATVYAEDAMLQADPGFITDEVDDASTWSDNLEHNLAVGASLNFFLGGYRGETVTDQDYLNKFSGGITGVSWTLEPFAGRLNYDSEITLDDTELLGARTGFGLGPYVDLRGYYWRGMNNDFDEAERIQSYGGEAIFNLNPSPGVEPHILLGVGKLDFMSGFTRQDGLPQEDKTVLIAGLGVDLTLSDRWHVSVDARDYVFGSSPLDDTDNPDDLFHNWMYSAGLSYTFGGHGEAGRRAAPVVTPAPAVAETTPAVPTAAPVAPKVAPAVAPAVAETVLVEKQVMPPEWMASPVRTYQGDRVVTLPVPTVGEIYIRYGEPGAVSIESKTVTDGQPGATGEAAAEAPKTAPGVSSSEEAMMRDAIRETLRQEMTKARQEWLSGEADSLQMYDKDLQLLESRLRERMDAQVEDRVQEELARRGVVSESGRTVTVAPPVTVVTEQSGGRGFVFRGVQGYTGVNVDEPNQWILGGRVLLQREGGSWPIYYVPELAFGFFDGTSILLGINVLWDLGHYVEVDGVRPYVSGGAGLLFFNEKTDDRDKNEGVLNVSYGVSKDFGSWTGFVEHQGVDLYSLHRINVGIGWRK